MATSDDRAVGALEDVLAIERGDTGTGMVRAVTMSDCYTVDVREERCECPDWEYHLEGEGRCKHIWAALDATGKINAGVHDLVDDLDDRSEAAIATDGGESVSRSGNRPAGHDQWTVFDPKRENAFHFDARPDADDKLEKAERAGVDADLYPPGESPEALYHAEGNPETDASPTHKTDGGDAVEVEAEVVDVDAQTETIKHTDDEPAELGERSLTEDPLDWVPGEFVDEIEGVQAINRKGYEVLSHFYGVDVKKPEVMVGPYESDFEYCQVRATAVTEDGRECSALGSAHVDRGDDPELLLEMADTRARKRALAIATGVGAVAVEELKNEVQ